jgi:hypothetical protein
MITMLALMILATVKKDVFIQIFLQHVKLTTNVTLTLAIHLLDVFSRLYPVLLMPATEVLVILIRDVLTLLFLVMTVMPAL